MEYQYKIIIGNRTVYKEFEIPPDMERVKLGTTSGCEFRLNQEAFFTGIDMELEKKEDEWSVICSDSVYISRGDMRKLISTKLVHGDILSVRYAASGDEAFELRFLIDFEAKIPYYNWKIDLSDKQEITIGDDAGSDIVIDSRYSGNNKVCLVRQGTGLIIKDLKSEYGILKNGREAVISDRIEECDFLAVANLTIYYRNHAIYFDKKNVASTIHSVEEVEPSSNFPYPLFVRNTRVRLQTGGEPIKILDPEGKPAKPEMNIVTTLMPTLVMFALVVVLRGIMSSSSGSYVLFSICSMGMGVVTSILSIINGQKKYKDDIKNRKTTYLDYIDRKKEEIADARQEELDCLNETYYSTEQDIAHIEKFDSCLFDRTPEDEDFLDVYLGRGRVTAKRKIDYKIQENLTSGDELSQIPTGISENSKYIENAPVVMKLKEANAVGIVGDDGQLYEMLKCILVDLVSRQYFGDIRLYLLLDENVEKYQWIRLLPHIRNQGAIRNIVCDNESKNNIFEYLYKDFTFRRESRKEDLEYNVILVMNEQGIKSHPVSQFIEEAAQLNTVFIFFENTAEFLPLHCSQIVELEKDNKGIRYDSADKVQAQRFEYSLISDQCIAEVVQRLAPIYCEEISLESSLRKSISLFELLGIYSVDDLDIGKRWMQSRIYDSMAVPLGVNVKDEIVYLNLHEKYHGPHGLVAGTTGSGKSEILQSYILGAATLFHPHEIGFVIIDFKGGGMVNQFKNLPHLIGAITNIDGKAIDRSLKSIKAELLKRQTLFAEAEVNHIDKYIKAYKEGKVQTALPHLVIIVDEFAELKAEQPEFMKELISTARIGRSLGVHLILATQKPAGQVNEQIWSNSKFKLCLKVQTKEDSNEVIKSPLAAEIREPGRAYLQVGNNEVFELFQSGFSGAPEKSDDSKMKKIELFSLEFTGNRKLIYSQKPEKNRSARTQLDAIVDYLDQYCKNNRIGQLPEICLPALEDRIVFDTDKHVKVHNQEMSCAIGIYDDPDHQYQGICSIEIGTQNTLIIGSSQFGKTNLLEVLIRHLAEVYSAQEVNMYIIDFGSMVLKTFEKLNHVGGVVCPADDEKLKNLFKFLNDQIAVRRERLLSVGVSSFSSYKEAGYRDFPQIVVFIDNLTALKELYLTDNDVLLNLCREGVSVGISFVVANAQTNGIGYKYLANYAGRISLFCNESSEYSNLFGPCRVRPDEEPGRGIISIDKTIYEYQTFLAFEGEKEIERVRAMQVMMERINEKNQGMHAISIPEIPELLTESFVYTNFQQYMKGKKGMVLGLDYATISPVMLEPLKNNLLAISGREGAGKTNFIRYFVHTLRESGMKTELTVFDDYRKRLYSLKSENENMVYNLSAESAQTVILQLESSLKDRYEALINEQPVEDVWKVIVINNEDVIAKVSDDKDAMIAFKNIIGKYKMLKAFILIGNVPNAGIAFGAAEIYKQIKENRTILFFDDLDNCKVVDIPISVVRNNRKKIESGDAYFIYGNDCHKIKTPLAVHNS